MSELARAVEARRAEIEAAVTARGLAVLGFVAPCPEDGSVVAIDGRAARALVLVGWRGRVGWAAFAGAPERRDGAADPLDRWSRRVVGGLADELGARALFPFEGPPWPPVQRWALRSGGRGAAPTGLVIDATVGPWLGFRGALAFAEELAIRFDDETISPCGTCATRPCLTACPADAFDGSGFAEARCRGHLEGHAGGLCRTDGCRARDACPIGRAHRYAPDQIRFLMNAFRASAPVAAPQETTGR